MLCQIEVTSVKEKKKKDDDEAAAKDCRDREWS